jgi:hypothetical protein
MLREKILRRMTTIVRMRECAWAVAAAELAGEGAVRMFCGDGCGRGKASKDLEDESRELSYFETLVWRRKLDPANS